MKIVRYVYTNFCTEVKGKSLYAFTVRGDVSNFVHLEER